MSFSDSTNTASVVFGSARLRDMILKIRRGEMRREQSIKDQLKGLTDFISRNYGLLFKKQHRDGKKRSKFSLNGSFKVGTGSTQVGNKQHIGKSPYFRKHNFKNTTVYLKPVEKQDISADKKEAYRKAKRVMECVDPDFAKGEFLVQFSHMNSADHFVKMHVDADDISPQYIFCFGEYDGIVKLNVYDKNKVFYKAFDCKDRILKVDGRLPHSVDKTPDFRGNRFAVIWYKSFDSRLCDQTPILHHPHFVYPSSDRI